ncbi:MAG: aminotransferase class I/II-fold pyridoxal phosphate-dependent enzyme, partial [Oscillospiraceae bacterium]|nr:aminotransferase class I/II-fold pyridoxal phosphate-dependent enzyme [Oscillospiraceae bacterium]
MAKLNKNYGNVSESYLFAEVARRVNAFAKANPDREIIRLGIGDVTLPLPQAAADAMAKAAEEQARAETFRGYGPDHGYPFAKEAVRKYYQSFGVELDSDEIFISEGAKSDIGNITELFAKDALALVPDPVYPVYVDTNVMDGREIRYIDGTAENGFLPSPPDFPADMVYLCSPNNPSGAVYNREQLGVWADYANDCGAVILFDAA